MHHLICSVTSSVPVRAYRIPSAKLQACTHMHACATRPLICVLLFGPIIKRRFQTNYPLSNRFRAPVHGYLQPWKSKGRPDFSTTLPYATLPCPSARIAAARHSYNTTQTPPLSLHSLLFAPLITASNHCCSLACPAPNCCPYQPVGVVLRILRHRSNKSNAQPRFCDRCLSFHTYKLYS